VITSQEQMVASLRYSTLFSWLIRVEGSELQGLHTLPQLLRRDSSSWLEIVDDVVYTGQDCNSVISH